MGPPSVNNCVFCEPEAAAGFLMTKVHVEEAVAPGTLVMSKETYEAFSPEPLVRLMTAVCDAPEKVCGCASSVTMKNSAGTEATTARSVIGAAAVSAARTARRVAVEKRPFIMI